MMLGHAQMQITKYPSTIHIRQIAGNSTNAQMVRLGCSAVHTEPTGTRTKKRVLLTVPFVAI